MSEEGSPVQISENPYQTILSECKNLLRQTLHSLFPSITDIEIKLEEPPSTQLGDLSTAVCFQISKILSTSPRTVAQMIAESTKLTENSVVESLEAAGAGYLNIRLNSDRLNELTLRSVRTLKDSYGFLKSDKPETILLEHSSINPVHSIHIGQARNSILGDSIFRILRARGHSVEVHFYINDAGRQSAIVAYGYKKLGQPKPDMKPDRYLSQIYSVTSCLVEIQLLKKKLKEFKEDESLQEERKEAQDQLDEWISIAHDLQNRHPEIFEKLSSEISRDLDPDNEINNLLRKYEAHAPSAEKLIRETSELCIDGFKQTFTRLGVTFDAWDWESDLLWSGRVTAILEKLLNTSCVTKQNGVLKLESGRAVEELGMRQILEIGDDYVLPDISLTRSDGTTLYVTRDIAYSLLKFEHCDRVVNVVGMEQMHEQLHVRVALSVLDLKDLAKKQKHFVFGLVQFPGEKMSSRRGRVVYLDDVIEEATLRAYREVEKRTPDLEASAKRGIAETIAAGAIKYALLAVEAPREVEFTWDRVLNLEASSTPFINYGYTRANGILGKLGPLGQSISYERLSHPLEKRLIIALAKFPSVFSDAADRIRPDDLACYANQLTKQFHEYYEHVDVSHLEDEELKNARGSLVEAVQIVIRNCMNVLGIRLSERM